MDLEDFKCNFLGGTDTEMNQLKKRVSELESETKMLKDSLRRIESVLQTQTSIMTKHTDYLEKLSKKHATFSVHEAKPDFFPINSKDNLDDIEEQLELFSEADILMHIRATAEKPCISKCLNRFFSTNFLHQINWDGKQKKMPIKDYRLFNHYFYSAFGMDKDDYSYSDFDKDMRHGFRIAKSCMYRLNYKMKHQTKNDSDDESHPDPLA